MRFVAVTATLILAGCSAKSGGARAPNEYEGVAVARILTETAARVAVSKPGAKVCRRMPIGISEHDWIRGVVTDVLADQIRVRIEDAGRFPHTLYGNALVPGALVSDTPLNWIPCV